ncbi:protein-L-isoaspartate O-methyltransferase [Phaeovulum sp.]|uniref:protein-L-isoaspartate O-methyltransferase family protein n=1 Tax=Phaeovulum sp. TaxID=2934796 RepID=UPI003568138C
MQDFATRRTIMVDSQIRPNDVTKYPVIEAMLAVPREDFVPERSREVAYVGDDIVIAPGRVMLEPRTLGKMLDALDLQDTDLVLDVGCGTGYAAALIARMAEAVVALDTDEFAKAAQATLAAVGADNAVVVAGELAEGAAKHGPYDAILVEGAVEVLPAAFEEQLREGGRIICLFRKGPLGIVRMGRKIDGVIAWRHAFNAMAPVLPGCEAERGFSF